MKPIENFVVRTTPEEVDKELNICSSLLDELVDVSSNILANDKSATDWIDNTTTMMFRNFIELVDSISILIKHSSPDTARIQLRSLVESYFSISYILLDDTRQKCKAFIVADLIDQNKLIQKLIDKHSGRKINLLSSQHNFQEIYESRLRILNSEELKDVHDEFLTIIEKSKNKKTPNWYRAFKGPNNVREMSIRINQEEFYNSLYSLLSADIHTTNVISGKASTDENGELAIHQLRCWDNARLITDKTINLSLRLFDIYVSKRAPLFANKYGEWVTSFDYRKAILNSLKQVVSKY